MTLNIESNKIGKPNITSGIDIITAHVISKLMPNIEKANLLRFRAKIPEANPKGNEIIPKIPVVK